MVALKKYQLDGKELGEVTVDEAFINEEMNSQLVKDYIVALRANARQWSASTKRRSEVNHSTKKPHRQKGLGRARQGSLAATQYRGGGRPLGPKPKFDQHVKINKKEKRQVIRQLLAEKMKEGQFYILSGVEKLKEPKTKKVAAFLDKLNLKDQRILFLGDSEYEVVQLGEASQKVSVHTEKYETFIKSVRNLPKVEFSLSSNVNGYDMILARTIFATEDALNQLTDWLASSSISTSGEDK